VVPQQFGDGTGDGDFGRGIAAQSDGKSVVVGIAASNNSGVGVIARYRPDGTLDQSFGDGGRVIDPTYGPLAVAIQPDGKIVAAGEGISGANSAFAVARYLPNGNLDPSFAGGSGKENVLINATDDKQRAEAVTIAPDGKIVAAGETKDGAGVVRLGSDGTPDASFNGAGVRDIPIDGDAQDVVVQPDGAVLLAIPTGAGSGDHFTIMRLDNHGQPDNMFGTGGTAIVQIGNGGRSPAVALQPDGKIVAGGYAFVGGGGIEFAVARLNTDGTPDMSFSGDGQEMTLVGAAGLNEFGQALVIQPNGRIVLAGTVALDNTGKDAIGYARYNPDDGSLDTTFGSGGTSLPPLPAGWGEEQLSDAALACDGKIVGEGLATITSNGHEQFLTTRLLGDPIPCPGLNPPPPPASVDHVKPHSKIHRIPRVIRASRLKKFFGTAADDSGLAKVEIALLRRVGHTAAFSRSKRPQARCLWLRSSRARFKTLKPRRGRCATPRFLRAQGTRSWVFKLRKRLPPGRYILYTRATDTSGNSETSFSSKLGNRAAFRVTQG
jgi:uncharacterized delta-60 repeat protein